MNLNLIRTNSENPDFRELVVLLDAELAIRDGADHAFFAQYNSIDEIKNVVVAYLDKVAVGCGAFKVYDDKTVEIKRMFVQSAHRGKGIAVQILSELERWAGESDFSFAVL